MRTETPSAAPGHRRAYMAPTTEVACLDGGLQLLAGSIETQDGDFIHVGDVVTGNEDNAWE